MFTMFALGWTAFQIARTGKLIKNSIDGDEKAQGKLVKKILLHTCLPVVGHVIDVVNDVNDVAQTMDDINSMS